MIDTDTQAASAALLGTFLILFLRTLLALHIACLLLLRDAIQARQHRQREIT